MANGGPPAVPAVSNREQRRLDALEPKRPRVHECILCPEMMCWEGVCRWCQNWSHMFCAKCKTRKGERRIHRVTAFSHAELQKHEAAPDRPEHPRCRRWERRTSPCRRWCKECGKQKSRTQIRHWNPLQNEGICRVCTEKAKKVSKECSQSQAQAKKASKKCSQCQAPLPNVAKPEAWCQKCAYPPCQGGCGRPRPQTQAYHAKRKAQWVCHACAPATCVKCGGAFAEGRADRRAAWCQKCACPPCQGGCGKARPRRHPYHAKTKPSWTCSQCNSKGLAPAEGWSNNVVTM